ncbi:hypothetical protein BLNAU_19565 [Blattamonas nauphoetae]|uniref:Uncharacterized protein n=1 Tax=Blattamonas nauphoetae TaxID=2049346 RepID=A0ABQ9X3H3_9EUKA|nr:hypothetical protein BLNAU_19565 [Blattamonas nauphoetae]
MRIECSSRNELCIWTSSDLLTNFSLSDALLCLIHLGEMGSPGGMTGADWNLFSSNIFSYSPITSTTKFTEPVFIQLRDITTFNDWFLYLRERTPRTVISPSVFSSPVFLSQPYSSFFTSPALGEQIGPFDTVHNGMLYQLWNMIPESERKELVRVQDIVGE